MQGIDGARRGNTTDAAEARARSVLGTTRGSDGAGIRLDHWPRTARAGQQARRNALRKSELRVLAIAGSGTSTKLLEDLLQEYAAGRKLASISSSTLKTYLCGARNYAKFCHAIGRAPFPPESEVVSIWLITFRRATTAKNYLTGLRFFTKVLQPSHSTASALKTDAIQDSLHVLKLVTPPPEKKLGIRLSVVAMIQRRVDKLWGVAREGSKYEIKAVIEEGRFAIAGLVAYTCALRVGSELLTLYEEQISFDTEARTFSIHLPYRKNIRAPVTIERPCVCASDPTICAYHRLIFLRRLLSEADGGRLRQSFGRWFPYTLTKFNKKLRDVLGALGVPNTTAYASHSFRRGSTQDITSGGGRASLTQVLRHQQVASASYRQYLDTREAEKLEFGQLVAAICDEGAVQGAND
ncbi:hypothetical protein FOZ63_024629 [Perkinsus olseni]|uniref:Core-binding (CB) domain-containing protein n=1 Tax=Perkinsus olseni TaxID=32597 RepID=A0A7J6RLG5_PEROL|nr:hypothetical protein FOZ62_025510 [Perkinsus olseni]KAF4749527.1 hypothetical protein FOZ63_024629 [Perkinsus olseni]